MNTSSSTALVRQVVRQQGRCWIPVTGTSMLPEISAGSVVAVDNTPFDAIEQGDVIAFANGSNLYVHRVMQQHTDHLITCGDNKALLDPPVSRADYIGKVGAVRANEEEPRSIHATERVLSYPHQLSWVHLWLFVASTYDSAPVQTMATACGANMHILPCAGIGVTQPTLTSLQRSLPASALKVGVSAEAFSDLTSVAPMLVQQAEVHLLIGCPFGGVEHEDALLLPPNLVDLHVRAGQPFVRADPGVTAAFILGSLATLSANHPKE